MSSSSSFSTWMAKQQEQLQQDEETGNAESSSLLGRLSGIQDSVATQFQMLAGSIDANSGPLSSAFQQRVKYSLYLFIASFVFGFFAILVGLPTIVLRPAKFVMCMTLCTSFSAASVIVMQTPSVFIANLFSAGVEKSLPFLCLVGTMLATAVVTIFVNRYLLILFCAVIQCLCLMWYLSTYIPGGSAGLKMLLRASYTIVSTAVTPCLFICKKTLLLCLNRFLASFQ